MFQYLKPPKFSHDILLSFTKSTSPSLRQLILSPSTWLIVVLFIYKVFPTPTQLDTSSDTSPPCCQKHQSSCPPPPLNLLFIDGWLLFILVWYWGWSVCHRRSDTTLQYLSTPLDVKHAKLAISQLGTIEAPSPIFIEWRGLKRHVPNHVFSMMGMGE